MDGNFGNIRKIFIKNKYKILKIKKFNYKVIMALSKVLVALAMLIFQNSSFEIINQKIIDNKIKNIFFINYY